AKGAVPSGGFRGVQGSAVTNGGHGRRGRARRAEDGCGARGGRGGLRGVSAGTGPGDEPPAGVPWRALALGALLLPLLTHFGHLSFIIAQSAVWTAETLLRGPVVLLFLLASWSLAWRKASPRLASTLCLKRQEVLVVH